MEEGIVVIQALWVGMILVGLALGIATGQGAEVGEMALTSAKEAVTLCLSMLGVMALWNGLMEIAREAGLIVSMSKGLRPLMRWLFPNVPGDHTAMEYMVSNMLANFLGLGWAATPLGLSAMKELAKLAGEQGIPKGRASVDMCTFLILNISSLQLIPVNIIAYRSQYGAVRPTDILGPAMVATLCSTLLGLAFSVIVRKVVKR